MHSNSSKTDTHTYRGHGYEVQVEEKVTPDGRASAFLISYEVITAGTAGMFTPAKTVDDEGASTLDGALAIGRKHAELHIDSIIKNS